MGEKQSMHEHPAEQSSDRLDIGEIMHAFGISEWRSLDSAALPHNASGLRLPIEVRGQRYLLKERPEGPLGEDSYHRYYFQRYLQQQGIPIPALRVTPEGEPFVSLGEDRFELQEWVDGEQFCTSDPQSLHWTEFAGSMLGQLHQASLHYPGPQHRWPSEVHIGGIVQSYLNLARQRSEQSRIEAIAAGLANWADQWEAVLPPAMISIGAGRGIPEMHIHGDYHAHNLLFSSSKVTAVMGLEASRWEKRIFEVAYALFYFSALSWDPEEDLARPLVKRGFDPQRAQRFLRAYSEAYPPHPGEAALLPDALLLISPIVTVNGPLEDVFYAQNDSPERQIDDLMERLSWASSLPLWLQRVRQSLREMWV
jgi:Ser/Thr protein kinase RdoA (MazF antagonist)